MRTLPQFLAGPGFNRKRQTAAISKDRRNRPAADDPAHNRSEESGLDPLHIEIVNRFQTLQSIADVSGLSVSYFKTAFRTSVGRFINT